MLSDKARVVQTTKLTNTPTGSTNIFKITGIVRITQIIGTVEGTFGAAACGTKLTGTVGALSAADFCTAVDLNAAAIGSIITLTGVITNAAVKTVAGNLGSVGAQTVPFIIGSAVAGTVSYIKMANAGAANAGRLRWALRYEPLTPGAKVEPTNF